MPRYRAVLFDLDGTLVETRRDITTAVNVVLGGRGLPPMSVEAVTEHVGRGARVLVTRCLQDAGIESPSEEEIRAAYAAFSAAYAEHMLDTSLPYPGVPEMLAALEAAGVSMAVVSNKPEALSERLLERLGLRGRFRTVIGGDTLPERKPDPAPLRLALERLGIGAAGAGDAAMAGSAAMAGDSEVDIQAARAAHIGAVAVAWGFGSGERLRAALPDATVDRPEELAAWLLGD